MLDSGREGGGPGWGGGRGGGDSLGKTNGNSSLRSAGDFVPAAGGGMVGGQYGQFAEFLPALISGSAFMGRGGGVGGGRGGGREWRGGGEGSQIYQPFIGFAY
jgi:hypothetical protein